MIRDLSAVRVPAFRYIPNSRDAAAIRAKRLSKGLLFLQSNYLKI